METAGGKVTRHVYSPQQVGVAAGLGGPLAGAVLIKLNYRALKNQPLGALPLAWGFVLTFALLILALRGHGGSILWGVWIGFSYWRYTNHLQGAAIAERLNSHTSVASWIRAVVISLAVVLGTTIVGVLLGYLVGV